MDDKRNKWKIIYRTPKQGQRYAIVNDAYKAPELRQLYVFDHSGSAPDCTDDGPLEVRLDLPFIIADDGQTFSMRVHIVRFRHMSNVMDSIDGLFGLLRVLRSPEVLGERALDIRIQLNSPDTARTPARAIMKLLALGEDI